MGLQSAGYDIIFLQETHCCLNRHEKLWSKEWEGKSLWSMGTNRSRGVAVLFKQKVNFDISNVSLDANGRYITFDMFVDDMKYHFVNIYAPNNDYDRIAFFNTLSKFIVDDCENLIAGDFNCTLNNCIDRKNCTSKIDKGQLELQNMIDQYDLEDVWRRRHPFQSKFSWQRLNKAARIDFWLISKSLDNQVDVIDYEMCPFSDHDCVKIQFRTSETEQGRGLWKMNDTLIRTYMFKKCFQSVWSSWKRKKS